MKTGRYSNRYRTTAPSRNIAIVANENICMLFFVFVFIALFKANKMNNGPKESAIDCIFCLIKLYNWACLRNIKKTTIHFQK